jgi:hypothetical protein
MNSSSIVFSDDEDRSWCNPPCDALLIERRDGSMICSYCAREYLPNSVKKHKRDLQPIEGGYEHGDLPLVTMTEYGSYKKPKKPSVFDREDRHMASRSGFSWTDVEDLDLM